MDNLHATFKNRLVAKEVHYGLDAHGIVDNDWFWGEVWLRANNNYSNWTTKRQAREWIIEAITDIAKDAGYSLRKTNFLISESKIQIKLFTQDMMYNS